MGGFSVFSPVTRPSLLNNGSLLGLADNVISNGLQMWHDTRMLKANQAYQQKMIEDERAYNDPASQMRRLRDAGINPHQQGADLASSQVGSQAPVSGDSSALTPLNMVDSSMLPYQQDESLSRGYLNRTQSAFVDKQTELVEHNLNFLDKQSDFVEAQTEKVRQNIKTDSYQAFVNQLKEAVLQYHIVHRLSNSSKLKKAVEDNPEFSKYIQDFDWQGALTGSYDADEETIRQLGGFIALALNNTVKFTSEQELMAYFSGIIDVVGSVPENGAVSAQWYGHKINSYNYQYWLQHKNARPQTFSVNNAYGAAQVVTDVIRDVYEENKQETQKNHNGQSPYESK